MKKELKALGKGVGYFAILPVTQLIVSIITLAFIVVSVMVGMQMAQGEGVVDPVEFQKAYTDMLSGFAIKTTAIADFVAVGLVAIIFKAKRRKIRNQINLMPIETKTIPILCLIGISFNILVTMILQLILNGSSVMESYNQASSSLLGEVGVINFIATVIAAPLAEEVFCRGLMLSRLRKGMPVAVAIGLQAFFFGLLHGHPVWIAYATVVGIVFGIIAYQQKSIVSTMIVHAVFNLTSFIMTAFSIQLEGSGICITTLILSVVVFSGMLVLLLKKSKIEYKQVEEPEALELANLEGDELIVEDNSYNEVWK